VEAMPARRTSREAVSRVYALLDQNGAPVMVGELEIRCKHRPGRASDKD